jgi:hypothetical protein
MNYHITLSPSWNGGQNRGWRELLFLMLPDFQTITFITRFPGFVHLPFLQGQHVDEVEYGASVDVLTREKPKY